MRSKKTGAKVYNRLLRQRVYPYDTRLEPLPPPSEGVFDYPTIALCINVNWASHVLGLLDRLAWEDAWTGTEEQIEAAIQEVYTLMAAFNSGGCGCLPAGTLSRVNGDGTYQISTDGGTTWTDAPEIDPRVTSTRFPPIAGADGDAKRCAAAHNISAYVENWIDQMADVLEAGGVIVGAVLTAAALLLSGGALLALAAPLGGIMFSAGAPVLRAAYDSGVYEAIRCAAYCNMGDDGEFTDFGAFMSDINDTLSGVAQIVTYNMFQMIGQVGVTNAAHSGVSTSDDCGDCDCDPCVDGCTEETIDITNKITHTWPDGWSLEGTGYAVNDTTWNTLYPAYTASPDSVDIVFPERCFVRVTMNYDSGTGSIEVTAGSASASDSPGNSGSYVLEPASPERIDRITISGTNNSVQVSSIVFQFCEE